MENLGTSKTRGVSFVFLVEEENDTAGGLAQSQWKVAFDKQQLMLTNDAKGPHVPLKSSQTSPRKQANLIHGGAPRAWKELLSISLPAASRSLSVPTGTSYVKTCPCSCWKKAIETPAARYVAGLKEWTQGKHSSPKSIQPPG